MLQKILDAASASLEKENIENACIQRIQNCRPESGTMMMTLGPGDRLVEGQCGNAATRQSAKSVTSGAKSENGYLRRYLWAMELVLLTVRSTGLLNSQICSSREVERRVVVVDAGWKIMKLNGHVPRRATLRATPALRTLKVTAQTMIHCTTEGY